MVREIAHNVQVVEPNKSLRIYMMKEGGLEPVLSVVRKGKRKNYKICGHAAAELIAFGVPYTVKSKRTKKLWP